MNSRNEKVKNEVQVPDWDNEGVLIVILIILNLAIWTTAFSGAAAPFIYLLLR